MYKEVVSDKQGMALMCVFIWGSSILLGVDSRAGKDVWISLILAALMAFPMVLIYARILTLFPGKDLFEIIRKVFGKFFGKAIMLLFLWYAFHLGALVLRNFGEFITTAGLPETPRTVPTAVLGLLCIWGVKEGMEVLGRWANLFIFALIGVVIGTAILLVGEFELDNLRPLFGKGAEQILAGSFSVFAFPFAETVVFLMVFDVLKSKKSAYRVFGMGLLIGVAILLVAALRNALVLGEDLLGSTYFPSYYTIARIDIRDFLQRLEILIAVSFIIAGFVKISVCLLAASKGIASIFNFKDYRFIVLPVGLLMINLAEFIYGSIMEMQEWAFKVYPYYAFPFQVILPLLVLVAAEIKVRSGTVKKEEQF